MRSHAILLCTICLLTSGARAETFSLVNGDTVSGEVIERSDEHVVLAHPILGHIVVPYDQIAPPEPVVEDAGAFGLGFFRGWTRQLSIGATGSAGNAQKMAVNGGLVLSKEDDSGRRKFAAEYHWGSSEGDEDTHKAFLDLERDWDLRDSSFYLFARAGYDFDRFRAFNQRVDGSTGIGYWWIEWPRWRFGTRFGAGASYQFDGESTFRPELVGGVDSVWTIAEGHTLEIHGDIFPDLADTGEFRTRTTGDWNFRLTEVIGLKVGVIHDYVSETDRKNHDLTYRGNLTYDF